jgi:thiol:disulfide interchange protein DsbD
MRALARNDAMRKIIIIFLLSLFVLKTQATESLSPLPADKAFVFSAYLSEQNQLTLEWNIAPGYYLYRNQLNFTPTSANQIQLGKIELPQGQTQKDILHGVYQAYSGSIKIILPLIGQPKGVLNLNVGYQGCSSEGFCYTPIKKTLAVNLSAIKAPGNLTQYVQAAAPLESQASSSNDYIMRFFNGRSFVIVVLSFLGLGLLLAFTPCVLPMVPILSGIIIGQGKRSNTTKSFLLSLAYVSGMAITYAIAGVVVALIGSNIQAQLQKPWIILLFSGLFVLLALSLFGFYELQLPARLRQLITSRSNQQKGGSYLGVFMMGCFSTLIVSPCVSAPLVGVLAYIGQSGDVILGAVALLALGIGMGIPLLLIGLSADRILPKAGPWMATLERVFGILMLGIAIWMLSRMVPGPVTLFLWGALAFFAAIFIGFYSPIPRTFAGFMKGASVLALIYSVILLIGAVTGNSDPLHPWEQLGSRPLQKSFIIIHSMQELDNEIAKAQTVNEPIILDFYADWCSACVMMDRTVFSSAKVQNKLDKFLLLRADLTANNAFDQALLKRFHVIGPPTILFFNRHGQELTSQRIVGEVNEEEFLQLLKLQE